MRLNRKRLHRQRAYLDARLAGPELQSLARMAAPRRGWLKAVRESLGMPAEQLATRLGVTKQAVLSLENNEVRGTATLKSLERAATALGCRLTYALVPEDSLEAILDARAMEMARRKLQRVSHSMSLEGQSPPVQLHDLQVAELARELKEKLGPELWSPG